MLGMPMTCLPLEARALGPPTGLCLREPLSPNQEGDPPSWEGRGALRWGEGYGGLGCLGHGEAP